MLRPVGYFVCEFDAAYELRPDGGERVTPVSETDEWRVVGIYLNLLTGGFRQVQLEFIIVTMSPLPHGNIGGRCATRSLHPPQRQRAARRTLRRG